MDSSLTPQVTRLKRMTPPLEHLKQHIFKHHWTHFWNVFLLTWDFYHKEPSMDHGNISATWWKNIMSCPIAHYMLVQELLQICNGILLPLANQQWPKPYLDIWDELLPSLKSWWSLTVLNSAVLISCIFDDQTCLMMLNHLIANSCITLSQGWL